MNSRDDGPNPRIATLHCAIVWAPDSQEEHMADDGTNFDWNDQDGIAVNQQDAIAVYANDKGDLIHRRQKDWNEEEDSVIVVARPTCAS